MHDPGTLLLNVMQRTVKCNCEFRKDGNRWE